MYGSRSWCVTASQINPNRQDSLYEFLIFLTAVYGIGPFDFLLPFEALYFKNQGEARNQKANIDVGLRPDLTHEFSQLFLVVFTVGPHGGGGDCSRLGRTRCR